MQARKTEGEVPGGHWVQSSQLPLAFFNTAPIFRVSQFLAECPSQGQAVTFPKWYGSLKTVGCTGEHGSQNKILWYIFLTKSTLQLRGESTLMKTGPKIDRATSNKPKRFSVFLTKEKTKVIYSLCHKHQKGFTLFLAKGREHSHWLTIFQILHIQRLLWQNLCIPKCY